MLSAKAESFGMFFFSCLSQVGLYQFLPENTRSTQIKVCKTSGTSPSVDSQLLDANTALE